MLKPKHAAVARTANVVRAVKVVNVRVVRIVNVADAVQVNIVEFCYSFPEFF